MRDHCRSRRIARFGLVSVSPLALAAGLIAAGAAPASADPCSFSGTPSVWSLGSSGNWGTGSNWTPSGAPNSSTTDVCIVDNTSTVTLDISSASIQNLQIASGNTLLASHALNIFGGSILNSGALDITGTPGFTILELENSATTLSGGGTVTLDSTAASAYLRGNGVTLTNVDNTIQGFGTIGDSGTLAIPMKKRSTPTSPAGPSASAQGAAP